MAEWNGVRMIPHPWSLSTEIWSDASGSFGCGAVCPSLHVKVDTAAVDSQTRDDESWGGGLYNVDGITSYLLS